ncbi:MAG TPA: polysaccharide deacetylase family protein [Cryomorphaceae bacterium]|nr:polysaccharide deacetylase family protein [Owenweeksia sp.]MBF99943.1 polysaccharide deacetylase family protein [Owenweeksia sp.]HAD96491.1 polysaccharide deacetylase family protein [Cryomorphaceae bacterium]HBF21661.1 polysaccharide deacetylase family protein [Cryomorphaceae bacterium]HCQ15389.1 polysaccharide deacetylase family protein [Cryomorphaceae bacterium]|tara:strand:- start:111 stop:737 length:627 start_codon:yes stop_codon:yes gene_type:complete
MRYFVNSPWWLRAWYPSLLWHKSRNKKVVYLTFDDGPHPEITPWVLEQLRQYDFTASFFLIGDNARKYPQIAQKIREAGHLTGNHTFHHVNGWKTDLNTYLKEVNDCSPYTDPGYFRPPYGRITHRQAKEIIRNGYEVVMWDVISGDFDREATAEQCFSNVQSHLKPGSIIVFHDSEKAWPHLRETLPKTLELIREKGLVSHRLDQTS